MTPSCLIWSRSAAASFSAVASVSADATSVAPFLLTLIVTLIGMSLLSSLFNLKRRFKQQKKDEKTLILYSESGDSGGFCHKISVIDEMKRRKPFIHSHYPHYHKPNPTDFKLPGI